MDTHKPPLTEETDPFCLSAAAAAELMYHAPWERFAVMGDSLSAGTGDPSPGYADLGWADRVAALLERVQPRFAYLNTSVNGATTSQTLDRQIETVIGFAPDLLHLPCGANDIVRRIPDYAEIERTLRRLYELAASTGAQLTTFTLGSAYVVPAFVDWHERVLAVNEITRRLAVEYGAMVVDMWAHPLNERTNLLSADGIHFSTSGQAVMATEFAKELAKTIGK